MAEEQLGSFMEAIAEQESGGNYGAVGPYTGSRYGRARGKYQIMETIWPGWAKEAGMAGASWNDPAAQERVARYKMSQYYKRYGSWDLVAVAWFAGPGRANTAQREGIGAIGNISDVLGTSVAKYVATMNEGLGRGAAPLPGTGAGGGAPGTGGIPGIVEKLGRRGEPQAASGAMARIMESISRRASEGGGKILKVDALSGDLFGDDSELSDPLAQYRPQERDIGGA